MSRYRFTAMRSRDATCVSTRALWLMASALRAARPEEAIHAAQFLRGANAARVPTCTDAVGTGE
jgi:hypothetical protein